MNDLVKRLRRKDGFYVKHEDVMEAADEIERLRNDLEDALDCKSGSGPTALSVVINERDKLRAALAECVNALVFHSNAYLGHESDYINAVRNARQALGDNK